MLLVVIAGFPGTVLAVYGLVRFLRGADLRPYRFLGWPRWRSTSCSS